MWLCIDPETAENQDDRAGLGPINGSCVRQTPRHIAE